MKDFNLDSLLRVYSEMGEADISAEAIKWAEDSWPAFLRQLENQARAGVRSVRVTSMRAQQEKGIEELRARLRMVALMTKTECEGVTVRRIDKVKWELSW